jgi:hypothetical protein
MASPQSPIVFSAEHADDLVPERGLQIAAVSLLFATGVVVGVVAPFALSWLAWMSLGSTGTAIALVLAAVYLLLLYVGCRCAGAGMEARYGAVVPALGWIVASLAIALYQPGGDIVVSDSMVNYLVMYGGMAAVALGVLTTPPDGSLPWSRRGPA